VSAFVAAGLADEFAIYLAPALLGGDKLALGDIGVGSMSGIRQLSITGIEQLGPDLLITARPVSTNSPRPHRPVSTSSTHVKIEEY
jgi:diaminohydroxyphosphoribosylaminopyrimidine deaminase/5-amino-6-(5-phosphoribosylamino)uracil reductase